MKRKEFNLGKSFYKKVDFEKLDEHLSEKANSTAFEKYKKEFSGRTTFTSYKDYRSILVHEMILEAIFDDKLFRVRKIDSGTVTYELQIYIQAPKTIGDVVVCIGQFHYEHLYEVIADLFRFDAGYLQFEFDEFGFIIGKIYKFKDSK